MHLLHPGASLATAPRLSTVIADPQHSSTVLLAPKAIAGFMNVAWSVKKQWMHWYNFFTVSVVVACVDLVLALLGV